MPDRTALIEAALERRGCAAFLRGRIEALLDGREDRERLTCCHSGCAVCVEDLKAVVAEVEAHQGR